MQVNESVQHVNKSEEMCVLKVGTLHLSPITFSGET